MKAHASYTPVVAAGNYYYISGQVGVAPNGPTPPNVKDQTTQALANLQELLKENGLDKRNVVKTTVFLAAMDDFSIMNDLYKDFFDAPRPARSTVAVHELPRLADTPILIEIEAVAYRP